MSQTDAASSPPLMTRGLALGLVVVSALSLLVFVLLQAFAAQLRPDATAGGDVLSKSAIGFAGLRVLLQDAEVPVVIDRGAGRDRGDDSLTILTPELFTSADELSKATRGNGAHLIILPKWMVGGDPLHPGWVESFGTVDAGTVAVLLDGIAKGTKVVQRSDASSKKKKGPPPSPVRLAWTDGGFIQPKISSLQSLAGKKWVSYIADDKGDIILANLDGTSTFVLADPDLLDTQGLADRALANNAVQLIDTLRSGDGPVVFDVTLNGFRASPDLLHQAFVPPFLGATLCALLAAAFIGFHAVSRFGPALGHGRAIAFGKRALADNTAGLIRMLGREPHMAPRYAQTLRLFVLRFLGAPRESAQADAWLARAETRAGGPKFAELLADSESARTVPALMKTARELYRWKQGIMNERR